MNISKNIFYQALAQVGGRGLMFFVYMLLARILGPALYGTFGYTLSSVQIISGIFFDLGLFLIVTRELSIGNNSVFLPAIWLKLGGCLLGSLLFFALIPILKFPLVFAVSLVIWAIFNSFTDFYFCIFRAKNKMHGEAIIMISQRVFLLGMLFLLYAAYRHLPPSLGLQASGGAFLCSALFGFLVALSLTKLMFPSFMDTHEKTALLTEVKSLAKKALPLVGVSFFGLIYYKIDIVLLGILSTNEQVGYYNAAYRIFEASLLIPIILANTLYPKLSFMWVNNLESFGQTFKKAVWASLLAAFLAGLCIAVFSKPIVATIFGSEFLPSADILLFLAGAIIVVYPGYILVHSLVILGKQRGYLYMSMCAAAINIVLNCLMIPVWQAKGAAAATVITEAMVSCISAFIIARQIRSRR